MNERGLRATCDDSTGRLRKYSLWVFANKALRAGLPDRLNPSSRPTVFTLLGIKPCKISSVLAAHMQRKFSRSFGHIQFLVGRLRKLSRNKQQ